MLKAGLELGICDPKGVIKAIKAKYEFMDIDVSEYLLSDERMDQVKELKQQIEELRGHNDGLQKAIAEHAKELRKESERTAKAEMRAGRDAGARGRRGADRGPGMDGAPGGGFGFMGPGMPGVPGFAVAAGMAGPDGGLMGPGMPDTPGMPGVPGGPGLPMSGPGGMSGRGAPMASGPAVDPFDGGMPGASGPDGGPQ